MIIYDGKKGKGAPYLNLFGKKYEMQKYFWKDHKTARELKDSNDPKRLLKLVFDLDYDSMANDPRFGTGLLNGIAVELYQLLFPTLSKFRKQVICDCMEYNHQEDLAYIPELQQIIEIAIYTKQNFMSADKMFPMHLNRKMTMDDAAELAFILSRQPKIHTR